MQIYQHLWHCQGLWSLQTQRSHRWYTVYSFFVGFTVLFMFNLCLVLSLFVANSIEDIVETLVFTASSLVTIIKVWIFLRSRRDVSKLINLVKRLETDSVTSLSERSILQAAKHKSMQATKFFVSSGVIGMSLLILNVFIQSKRSLIWSSVYPMDWQSNYVWYTMAMIYQVVCTSFIAMLIVSLDMWRVAAFYLLAGFLDILSGRMQRLGWSKTNILKKADLIMVKENRLNDKEIIDCVKYHLLCLK